MNACMERDASIRPTAAEIVELLSGNPAVLEKRRKAHASTDPVCGDAAEVMAWHDMAWHQSAMTNGCGCSSSTIGATSASTAAHRKQLQPATQVCGAVS